MTSDLKRLFKQSNFSRIIHIHFVEIALEKEHGTVSRHLSSSRDLSDRTTAQFFNVEVRELNKIESRVKILLNKYIDSSAVTMVTGIQYGESELEEELARYNSTSQVIIDGFTQKTIENPGQYKQLVLIAFDRAVRKFKGPLKKSLKSL